MNSSCSSTAQASRRTPTGRSPFERWPRGSASSHPTWSGSAPSSPSRDLVDDDPAEVRYRAGIEPGFQDSYGAMFPAPQLVAHEGRVLPLGNANRLLELVPRAELHVFGRCGHWRQIEHAAAFNRLVLEFLTRD